MLKRESTLPGNVNDSIVGDCWRNICFVFDVKLNDFDPKLDKFNTMNADNVQSVSKGFKGLWKVNAGNLYRPLPKKNIKSLL